MDNTANYRKHGALLSLSPDDALFLASRGLAKRDLMGDGDGLVGMSIPGEKIDRYIPDGNRVLWLVGGVVVKRSDESDAVIGVHRISVSGLFDKEEEV